MRLKNGRHVESYRHTRVKLRKSGKHWVSTVVSTVGTVLLGKTLARRAERSERDELEAKLLSPNTVLKGAGALGALVGGAALATDEAFAEETVASSEVASDVLATQDEVVLKADSVVASEVVSEVASSTEVTVASESKETAQ